MSAALDYNSILQMVTKWPPEQRVSLANDLLATLRPASGDRPTIDQFIGVARPEGAGPTNEELATWIDEHRMQKYGG